MGIIEDLISTIPCRGMSRDCQKIIPLVARGYFKDKKTWELGLSGRKEKFAEEIYKRIEQMNFLEKIREKFLKKILNGSMIHLMGHPDDYKDNPAEFTDRFFRYCMIRKDLKKRLIENCGKLGIEKDFLIERYEENKSPEGYYETLETIGEERSFYISVENLLDN